MCELLHDLLACQDAPDGGPRRVRVALAFPPLRVLLRRRRVRKARLRTPLRALGRRLVVVDVENIIGGAALSAEAVEWARQTVVDAIGLRPDEQVIVGTSHIGLLNVALNWPAARRVVRSGHNGADLALMAVLTDEAVAERFSSVVLVSGDGIFVETIKALAAHGVPTNVVARSCALSHQLRLAAAVVPVPKRAAEEVA